MGPSAAVVARAAAALAAAVISFVGHRSCCCCVITAAAFLCCFQLLLFIQAAAPRSYGLSKLLPLPRRCTARLQGKELLRPFCCWPFLGTEPKKEPVRRSFRPFPGHRAQRRARASFFGSFTGLETKRAGLGLLPCTSSTNKEVLPERLPPCMLKH